MGVFSLSVTEIHERLVELTATALYDFQGNRERYGSSAKMLDPAEWKKK